MSRYEDIWHENVSDFRMHDLESRTGYNDREQIQAHLSIYMGLVSEIGRENFSRGELYELWSDYTNAFVGADGSPMARDDWFNNMGIDQADFDWEAWRAAMGYQ